MPFSASRRTALAGFGATLMAGAMSPRMAQAAGATSGKIAQALAIPEETESVALWGSSSMEGGLGEEHTPKPVFIHEELHFTFNPRPVHHVAYGAQWSNHSTLLRGLDTPFVRIPEGYTGGKTEVQVDTPVPALWTFTCRGTLDSGATGTLLGSKEKKWYWEGEGPARSGVFTSGWKSVTKNSRHVLWTGKNNISDLEQVDSDIDRLVRAARDPERDVIVLGQWVTKNDLDRPQIIENIHVLNARHAARYGRRFVDVQAILTSDAALYAEPLWELELWTRDQTAKERALGIVPDPLRGSDGVHLSGWGNLLVVLALVERMKELQWV